MIYLIEENKFVDSLNQIQADHYDFYKQGCLLSPLKLQIHLKKEKDKPIIAKCKGNNLQKKASDNEVDALAQGLDPEEKDIFSVNRRVIFEEWRKFKYIRPGQNNNEGLSVEKIDQLKQKFINQGRNCSNCSSEELDYLTKNWRQFLREAAFSDAKR